MALVCAGISWRGGNIARPVLNIVILSYTLAFLGLIILLWRIWPRRAPQLQSKEKTQWPFVSIFVPARDEEQNLQTLLPSLKELDYPHYEVIVIDDQSTDRTAQITRDNGFLLVEGKPPPVGWVGKNWACHQALSIARGDIFLFTDADTRHLKAGLKKSVQHFERKKADMMSALPFHRCLKWWEKLLGPFHSFLLAATAPFSPRPRRLFAMGPYLMFSRDSYFKQGGHEAVKGLYPDDLMLANKCLEKGGKYILFYGDAPFEIRMYPTFKGFIKGWRRNFLAGIQQSRLQSFIEVVLIICAVTAAGRWNQEWMIFIPMMLALLFLAWQQRYMGNFSIGGVILFPFSILLFCFVTILSWIDYFSGNRLDWKGRTYENWVK